VIPTRGGRREFPTWAVTVFLFSDRSDGCNVMVYPCRDREVHGK
jgi:hypothetical protein